jgi:hypothetical protein
MDGLSVMTTILRCLGRAGVSGKRIEWRPVLQKLERDCGGVAKTVEGTASNRQMSPFRRTPDVVAVADILKSL